MIAWRKETATIKERVPAQLSSRILRCRALFSALITLRVWEDVQAITCIGTGD